jgi:hypothetical protein
MRHANAGVSGEAVHRAVVWRESTSRWKIFHERDPISVVTRAEDANQA